MKAIPLFFLEILVLGPIIYFGIAYWARFSKISKTALSSLILIIPILAITFEYYFLSSKNYSMNNIAFWFSMQTIFIGPFFLIPFAGELSHRQDQKNVQRTRRLFSIFYFLFVMFVYIAILATMLYFGISLTQLSNGDSLDSFVFKIMAATIPFTAGPALFASLICSLIWDKVSSKIEIKRALQSSRF